MNHSTFYSFLCVVQCYNYLSFRNGQVVRIYFCSAVCIVLQTFLMVREANWIFTPKLGEKVNVATWILCTSLSSYQSALYVSNSAVLNIQFDELDFFPSLNWIFLPAVACTIQD